MDVAYDHIQEENFPETEAEGPEAAPQSLNVEIQEAFTALSNSPWGARLGGLWGSVKKQGESYYDTAQKEVTTAGATASKGFTDILSRTRAISLSTPDQESSEKSPQTPTIVEEKETDTTEAHPSRPDSLPADIYKEASKSATSLASRLRTEAARRLKEAQHLEDAADEALLQWGTSLTAFLKDAVSIAPPSTEEVEAGKGEVLFASRDAEGKRVVHATRFEAQLYVIHCSLDSFLKDPASTEFEAWKGEFDVEKRTEEIARDLGRYEKLREAMEKCVPEKVEYAVFWCRYYFLRHVVETEEARRRELLKGAAANATNESVAWDESDDEDAATPKLANASTSTLLKPDAKTSELGRSPEPGKLAEPRKSNDLTSMAGSDTSYDIVSGATSRTPGSPREVRKAGEESEEEDWE